MDIKLILMKYRIVPVIFFQFDRRARIEKMTQYYGVSLHIFVKLIVPPHYPFVSVINILRSES